MASRRTNRWVALLAAGVAVAAGLVVLLTCDAGDPPSPAQVRAAAPAPAERAPKPAPTSRSPRRVRGAADEAGSRTFDGKRAEEAEYLPDEPLPDAPSPDKPASGMGRVKVVMLNDGRPFEGGHVCFYPADKYVEAKPWDGAKWSDNSYAGVPYYTAFWPGFEPVLGSGDGAQHGEERTRGVTAADGTLAIDVRANVTLVPYVRFASSGIPLVAQPRVTVADGGETSLTIEAAPMRVVSGRCVDDSGRPLAGIWVQAIAPQEERPVSRSAETSAGGAFELQVFGKHADVRVRAIVPYFKRPLGIYEAESDVVSIPAETTVAGVVPGGPAVVVTMRAAPVVIMELTTGRGFAPPDLHVEGLVFDARASAWGRLGGPHYRRAPGVSDDSRRGFAALPVADAVRPLMLWGWGSAVTAVDPRGLDRISAVIPGGRRATLRGRGWRETDRLRVVAWLGPHGEFPCIWLDGPVGKTVEWTRDDAPRTAIEFQIVRDDAVIGRARVDAGTEPAPEVSIDVQ